MGVVNNRYDEWYKVIFVCVIMGSSENEAKVKFLEEMNKEREKEMEKKE